LLLCALLVLAGTYLAQAQDIVTTVPVATGNPRGVAADPTRNLIYVANSGANQVLVINGTTNTIVRTFPTAGNVEGIEVDPVANRIYTGYSRPVRVLDAATGNEVGQINESIYGDNEIALNPSNHKLYLADWSTIIGTPDRVRIFDTRTLGEIGRVDLGLSQNIQRIGVAVNPVTGMAYATYNGDGSIAFIDGQSNQIVMQFQLPEQAQKWVAVNPATNRVYVKCTDGVVVLDGTSGARLGVIPGQWDIAVNKDANRIYLAQNREFRVVDGWTNAIVGQLQLPKYKGSGGLDSLPTLGRVYVALGNDKDVVVIQDVGGQPPATPSRLPNAVHLPVMLRS
jgi:YVTN family beta-propeller protein